MSRFNPQPTLTGQTLILRPLATDDANGMHKAASDPAIWVGHPVKNRYKREVFMPYFQFLLASGTTLAILDKTSDQIIGLSRYYIGPDAPDDIGIGFTFLSAAYWGGSTNFELKRLMLGHAFASFDRVWFHIDPTNVRSQKATVKLGAMHVGDAVLDLAGAPASWMCFCLERTVWQDGLKRRC